MSIVTQGFGGAPLSTGGWGYLGTVDLNLDKVEFVVFISRMLPRDVRILRTKEVWASLSRLLKRDVRIVRKLEEDVFGTRRVDREVEQ